MQQGETNMVDLKAKPFNLNDKAAEWVRKTLASMSTDDKVGQIFCLAAYQATEEEISQSYKTLKPGGIMYRPMKTEEAVNLTHILEKYAEIPMLIAANLERGANGIVEEGTLLDAPLGIAATDDSGMAEKLGLICGREGAAVGANWAFAPIIDIDNNFRNPITNTRTFGSDPERVKKMGVAYVKAVQSLGLAASIKHFPGDGMDERDQHLVSSINSLGCDEWMGTYGSIYKACIDAGALTCMIGHIMQPAWSKRLNPTLKDEDILPASLSPELKHGLLRGKLGFNGMIVTDATTMAGFTIPMPREKAVPYSIASGADMFLFTKNLEEDYSFMKAGVENGIITEKRLDDAVTRILAVKAALRLYEKRELPTFENAKKIIGCAEHRQWAKECADKAVTLVKEEKGVLPLTTDKYKKILFYPIESEQGIAYSVKAGVCDHFRRLLEQEGFEVDTFQPPLKGLEGLMGSAKEIEGKYDLIVYLANMSTKSNQTTVRIEWAQPMGSNIPSYINSVPTIFISVENPYHLLDVPRVKTFINAYNSSDENLNAIIDKLTGRSEFKGVNPVDPFCGKWDTKL
jgi:beta-N-acetylhexosaminidase